MKFTTAFFVPFFLFTTTLSAPTDAEDILAKKSALISGREASTLELEARAPVTGTVNGNGVRYRRCERTSCEAVGQYDAGRVITIICRKQGECVNGSWW